MNFGVVFCAVGLVFWVMQVVYKVTVCAEEKGKIPTTLEYQEWVTGKKDRRNARAMKIGATFFFLFGVFGWVITAGQQSVYLQSGEMIYAAVRLLLPFLAYVNISMRFLIYRFSPGYVKSTGATELRASLRYTGFFPDGDDIPSRLVRWTNVLVMLGSALLLFWTLPK